MSTGYKDKEKEKEKAAVIPTVGNNKAQNPDWYDKSLGRFIPRYALLPLLFCLFFDCFIYFFSKLIIDGMPHYDMTIMIDEMVPFRGEWSLLYFGCFLFWGFNFILASREGKEHWFRFFAANILSLFICMLIFIFVPTTMPRPEIDNTGVIGWIMNFLYTVDTPTNLFPSVHCLASWFCFMGIRRSRRIHISYKIISAVIALLVCLTTLLVKQHVFVDTISGLFLAELTYQLSKRTNMYKPVMKVCDKVNAFVFRKHV